MDFNIKYNTKNITDEELVLDLRRVAQIYCKETITIEEYDKFGNYQHTTFYRRFGSWTNSLIKSGLKPIKKQYKKSKLEKKEIIDDIKKIYEEHGNVSANIYKQKGKFPFKTVKRLFNNSWENVLQESGLPLNCGSRSIKDIDLLIEIERIWETLCRQPTTSDIKKGFSKFSLNTFIRRFGSWENTLKNFSNYIEIKEKDARKIIEDNSNETLVCSTKIFTHTTKRDINLRLRYKVLLRDNFKCCKCGRSPATTPGLELHIDHIKPWANGGETVIENLQTLCSDCNLGKSDVDI